jgi:hypothetical protein
MSAISSECVPTPTPALAITRSGAPVARHEIPRCLVEAHNIGHVQRIGDDGARQPGARLAAGNQAEDRVARGVVAGKRLTDARGGAGDDDPHASYFCLRDSRRAVDRLQHALLRAALLGAHGVAARTAIAGVPSIL